MRGIEEKFQSAPSSKIDKCIDITSASPDMDTENCAGSGANQLLHLERVEIVRGRIDIAEYRGDSQPSQRMRGSHESKRWKNDFAGETERSCQDLQPNGRVADTNAMLHTDELANSLLKFLQ